MEAMLRAKRASYFKLGIVFVLLCLSAVLRAKPTKDAPKDIWYSPQWNLERNEFDLASTRFGPGLNWSAGDAIDGERNSGYKFIFQGFPLYIVFYEGEAGSGMRIAESPAAVLVFGFAAGSPNPEIEKKKIPAGPVPDLTGAFVPPADFGMGFDQLVSELGKPFRDETRKGIHYVSYNWDCEKCSRLFPKIGKIDGVQTSVTFGAKKGRIVFYDVSRAWGL
jgi:hypothetical protein